MGLSACGVPLLDPAPLNDAPDEAPDAPPGARPGACWARADAPTQLAPVRTRVLVKPAEVDAQGTIISPPEYRTDEAPLQTKGEENWFETPCAPTYTPEFNSSLQRALQARDYYLGPITGLLDDETQNAVRRFQKDEGLDSAVLSVAAARRLGLVVVTPEPSD